MNRAPRSTRAMLADAEQHQSQVISALIASDRSDIAGRLLRCQLNRVCREDGWPWRCRSAGCWQCRRTMMRQWWRGFRIWLDHAEIRFATIPLVGDLISGTKKLRKGLRDVRDRAARHSHRWRFVAMAGLMDGDHALILIKHCRIDRAEIWTRLESRWPNIVLGDPANIEPAFAMTVTNAAALACRRRGIEPLRIVIPPQLVATGSLKAWAQPMPITF